MDLAIVLTRLREELHHVEAAILSLERLRDHGGRWRGGLPDTLPPPGPNEAGQNDLDLRVIGILSKEER